MSNEMSRRCGSVCLLYFFYIAGSCYSVGLSKLANVTVVNVPVGVEVFKVHKDCYPTIVRSDKLFDVRTHFGFRESARPQHLTGCEDSTIAVSGGVDVVNHFFAPQFADSVRSNLHLVSLQQSNSRTFSIVGVVHSPLRFFADVNITPRFAKFLLHILRWISPPNVWSLVDLELFGKSSLRLVKLRFSGGLGDSELVLRLSKGGLSEIVSSTGFASIDKQEKNANEFRPKFYSVAPILFSLAGYLITVWGWWGLYWRDTSGWRELRYGLAVLGGICISYVGILFLGARMF
jgi:hypothetical protein